MKLETEVRPIDLTGAMATRNFTIHAGRHIMTLLSNLYTNPLDAIVREYLTNMNDAYVALRRKNPNAKFVKPIIHAPTSLSPELIFKDFGTGMSVEDVWNIYFKYGVSTKNNNNDEAGGFGLGCKSAFCYNAGTNWTIESRYNGTVYTFFAYIDAEGMPTGSLVSSMPTDEPNGMTIQIPIKRTDLDLVHSAIKKYAPFFPLDLTVQNVSVVPMTYDMSGNNWGFTTQFDTHMIVMGGVPYPLATEQYIPTQKGIQLGISKNRYYQANKGCLVLTIPVGAVDLVPSRDSMMYTDRTKTALNNAIDLVWAEFEVYANKLVEAANTPWEKFTVARSFSKWQNTYQLSHVLFSKGTFRADIFPINSYLPTDAISYVTARTRSGYPDKIEVSGASRKGDTSFIVPNANIHSSDDPTRLRQTLTGIVINDTTHSPEKVDALVKGYIRQQAFKYSEKGNLERSRSNHVNVTVLPQMTVSQASALLGNVPEEHILLLSALNVKPVRVSKPRSLKRKIYRYSNSGTFTNRGADDAITTLLNVYVPLVKSSTGELTVADAIDVPLLFLLAGFDDPKYSIGYFFGVMKDEIPLLDQTWVPLEKWAEDRAMKRIEDNPQREYLYWYRHGKKNPIHNVVNSNLYNLVTILQKTFSKSSNTHIKTLLTAGNHAQYFTYLERSAWWAHWDRLPSTFKTKVETFFSTHPEYSLDLTAIKKATDALMSEYPLFELFYLYGSTFYQPHMERVIGAELKKQLKSP